MPSTGRSNSRGFSLTELLVGLAILAFLGGLGMAAAVNAKADARSQQMLAQVTEVVAVIERLYRSADTYAGLSATVITPHLPVGMRGATTDGEAEIESIYGPISVQPSDWVGSDANQTYQLSFEVPGKRECLAVGNGLIGQWPYIKVREEIIHWVSGTTAQQKTPTGVTMAAICNQSRGGATPLFTLKKP